MSKFIDELVEDIRNNPTAWTRIGTGITKENVILSDFGNGALWFFGWGTSVCKVSINDRDERLTWYDRFKLEEVFIWWMEQVPLSDLKKMKL